MFSSFPGPIAERSNSSLVTKLAVGNWLRVSYEQNMHHISCGYSWQKTMVSLVSPRAVELCTKIMFPELSYIDGSRSVGRISCCLVIPIM